MAQKNTVEVKINSNFDDGGQLYGRGVWELDQATALRFVKSGRAVFSDAKLQKKFNDLNKELFDDGDGYQPPTETAETETDDESTTGKTESFGDHNPDETASGEVGKTVDAVIADDGAKTAEVKGTALPADFPARHVLVKHGVETYEQLAEKTEADLIGMDGIAEGYAKQIGLKLYAWQNGA